MKYRLSIIAVMLFLILAGVTPPVLAEEPQQDMSPLTPQEWQVYRELSTRIKEAYVDPVDDKRLFNACLDGMAKLDPYSYYLDAKAYQEKFGELQNPAGVGLEFAMKGGRHQVVSALPDSPASEAGIRRGDVILKIDGTPIGKLSLSEAAQRMQGKPDTKIRLTLLRDGADTPLDFNLTRRLIDYQTVNSKLLESGYGYIKVRAFHRNTLEKFVEAMQSLYTQNQGKLNGLVLDLRDNPGGLFDKATALAAAFLPTNTLLLSTKGQAKDASQEYKSSGDGLSWSDSRALQKLPGGIERLPLVMLVNDQSAAGSEIVAGALQDHQRALIIGTPTFGKDSIQTVLPMNDQSAVILTTSRWQTPKGRSSAPDGIMPDIRVEDTAATATEQDDKVLARALAELKSRYVVPTVKETTATEPQTPQTAIDALRKEAFAATSAHSHKKAINLWNQVLAKEHEDPQALRMRGVMYAEQGKHDLARRDHKRAIELEPNSSLAWDASCWGKLLTGNFASAQGDCEKAVALDPGAMASTVNLGHTWLLRGNKTKAWSWYKKAIPLLENKEELEEGPLKDFVLFKKRGWKPRLCQTTHDWFAQQGTDWLARKAPADALLAEAKAAEAAGYRIAEIRRRKEYIAALEELLDPAHPVVIRAVNTLADTYTKAEWPSLALPLYRRVFDYRKNLAGSPPQGLVTTITDIAGALSSISQSDETIPALEQLLPVAEKIWGANDETTLVTAGRLASEYLKAGEKPERALELAQRIMTNQDQQDAPVEKKLNTLLLLAGAHGKLGQYAEAIPYLERTLNLLETNKTPSRETIDKITETLADTSAQAGQVDQALSYYERVLVMRRGVNNLKMNFAKVATLGKIAMMLADHGRLEAATPYLEEALRLAEKVDGKDGLITKRVVEDLAAHRKKIEQGDAGKAKQAP
ncbi:MAG: S41 family peptidase [Desulfobulbia bacterium]